VPSHQINESNLVEVDDGLDVQIRDGNIISFKLLHLVKLFIKKFIFLRTFEIECDHLG
jgi:hypothetical protein